MTQWTRTSKSSNHSIPIMDEKGHRVAVVPIQHVEHGGTDRQLRIVSQIEAVPDMLAALHLVFDVLPGLIGDEDDPVNLRATAALGSVFVAIQKAEGRS